MTHDLKTTPDKFSPIADGTKRFEFRVNDRNFAIGDLLTLREWEQISAKYTGRTATARVNYLMVGDGINMSERYVIMSLGDVVLEV